LSLPPNPSHEYLVIGKKRHPATCEWFAEQPAIRALVDHHTPRFLQVSGPLGCGKSGEPYCLRSKDMMLTRLLHVMS